MHILGTLGGENAVQILEALLDARPQFPIDAQDGEGNTSWRSPVHVCDGHAGWGAVLLLAYMAGNAQLCKAAVEAGVCLGTPNADGVSIFSHPTPTKQLLFRLLG